MSLACPTEDELISLLDGESTENRASELRAHIARCSSCREAWSSLERLAGDLAAPVPGVPSGDAIAKILSRIEAGEPPRGLPVRRAPRWAFAAAGVAAAAAAAALWLAPGVGDRDPGALASRGGAVTSSLRRNVGVTVHRTAGRLGPLAAGDPVTVDTGYAVSYTNLGADSSAFLMVFAVDSKGDVHWIQPAYLDAAEDPSAVALLRAASEKVLPTAGVLDSPSPGRLRIVTLVTTRPLRVSQIESLEAAALNVASLSARFPDAEIQEISVNLGSPIDEKTQ